jgi:hypothetical protein
VYASAPVGIEKPEVNISGKIKISALDAIASAASEAQFITFSVGAFQAISL